MLTKKNPKADLERMRGIFFQAGLVIALIISIVAIQWRSGGDGGADLGELEVTIDDEIIPITQRQMAPPPPPPEVIEVVEDDVELEEELTIQSTETDQEEEVEVIDIEEEVSDEALSFAVVESVPIFPGCENAKTNEEKRSCFQQQILKYVSQEFKFPEMARQMGIQGRVYINFVIEKDGSISNVQVLRGVDPLLDDEAVRVVNSLPKMTPAKQRGKSVRMQFTLPINAKLQ